MSLTIQLAMPEEATLARLFEQCWARKWQARREPCQPDWIFILTIRHFCAAINLGEQTTWLLPQCSQ